MKLKRLLKDRRTKNIVAVILMFGGAFAIAMGKMAVAVVLFIASFFFIQSDFNPKSR